MGLAVAEIEGSFWDRYHFALQWLLDANVPSVLRARKYQIGTGQEEVDQFKCIKCPYVSLGSCQQQGSWKVGVTVPGAAGYGTGQEGRWVPGIDGTDSLVRALGLQNLSHTWARLFFSKPYFAPWKNKYQSMLFWDMLPALSFSHRWITREEY